MRRLALLFGVGCLAVLIPAAASAQSSIAGNVRDASGAVLPGVTVEASSPALIERSRTVVTDDQGRYAIVDLRPGLYKITFTLQGFTTFVRDAHRPAGEFHRDGERRPADRRHRGIGDGDRRFAAGRRVERPAYGRVEARSHRRRPDRPHLRAAGVARDWR